MSRALFFLRVAGCGLTSFLVGCATGTPSRDDPVARVWYAERPQVAREDAKEDAKPQADDPAPQATDPAPQTASQSASRPTTKRDPRIAEAIRKGIAYLVANQQPNGSWGKATETRGYEVVAMVPGTHDGFRVATTALAVMALREVGEKTAHDKGLRYLIEHGEARRDDGALLYNVWAHKYALQALSIEIQVNPDRSLVPQLRKAAEYQMDRLKRYETWTGGWNYYDFDAQTQSPSMEGTSFGTAAGLVALWEAKRAGLEVPEKMLARAIRRLEEMRTPTGSYLYSGDMRFYPRFEANKMRGSLGRAQSANYALWLWGSKKVGKAQALDGLDWFFRDHAFIEMGRQRQYPHEAWYKTAPYYYYFGHYYTGLLLEKLGEEGKRKYGKQLADVVLPHQEPDGSWWDYAMWGYHKPYGTAFAVMTLLRCE
jgi:hypothetical protein